MEQNKKNVFIFGVSASYISFIISVIVGLISVKIGLNYFGPTTYGIWLIIYSIVGYFQIANFGISLSSMNQIAYTSNIIYQRVIIRRSIIILSLSSFIIFFIIMLIARVIPDWIFILGKIPMDMRNEAAKALFVVLILFLAHLPTTIFYSVFSGLQEIHWTKIYGIIAPLASLIALYITVRISGNLITLALFTGISRLIVGLISGIHLFIFHPQLQPWIKSPGINKPSYRTILSNGLRFLGLQIGAIIILNTDNLIISHYLGSGKVPVYAVAFKLFYMGIMMVNMITTVLWPMYARAIGKKDWVWINRTYNSTIATITIFGSMLWVGGILFSEGIIKLWVGSDMYGSILLIFALGGYGYMVSFAGSNVSLLNALNPTTTQVLVFSLDAIFNITLSLLLIKPFGIAGVALGTFISCVIVHSWFPAFYIKYRTQGKVKLNSKTIVKHLFTTLIPFLLIAIFLNIYLQLSAIKLLVSILIFIFYVYLSWKFIPVDVQNKIKVQFLNLRAKYICVKFIR